MSERSTRPEFRFGRFVLLPGERHLLADGAVVPLESRAFDVLRMLVENAGRLVTKAELLDAVWPARVVEDGNLHVQISALRKAIGGGIIATVPGHGYRFSAPVAKVDVAPAAAEVPTNLPRQLASFVGREDDLVALEHLLPLTRLVTLTGMGGCGKTRLAIALAERVAAAFPDGVHFVDLAPVAEAARVAPVVAATLRIREDAEIAIADTLARHLAERRMLVVLDNCENLLDACAALAGTLLAATSALCIVVTSRERLGIAGERVVPVSPLALPPAAADHDPVAAGTYAAVRLFVERAAHGAPGFRLDAGNVAAIVEICRRLDGIPLALELAAARVALLSVEQIRARLDDRFRLLTGSPRAVTRHQTLLATLQSSYDALAEGERRCVECLSVFSGGWTLAAATAVAADGDDIDTLQRLSRLVDTSFVQVDRDGGPEPRYGMLETVRDYAYERLVARGTERDARERHLAHFAAFARIAQVEIAGATMRDGLRRIDAELPNLLAAHAWCDHARDGTNRGLELAANLRMYWLARGYFAVGHRVHEEALARPGGDPKGMLRGKALHAFGQHHYVRGRLADSIAPIREALAIAQAHGDDEWAVYCLDRLCLASGWLGDPARARDYCDEEMAAARRTGKARLLSFALTAEGGVQRAEGNFAQAARAYEEALRRLAPGEDPHNRYNALVNVGRVSIALGALPRARETLAAAIRLAAEMGTLYRGHFALEAVSRLASAAEAWKVAARLQGASDAAVDRMGGTRTWFDDPVLADLHAAPQAKLRGDAFRIAYDGGRGIALEAALDEAIAWIESGTRAPDSLA